MLKEERHQLILEKISTEKKVNLIELSQLLNVSYDSIRRDIIELEDKGLLKKVHGGAIAANAYFSANASKTKGMASANPEMQTIAKKAQQFIHNNQIVIMDGGSTNFFIAEQISKNIESTIITNHPLLAMALSEHAKIDIKLLGGTFYKRYLITLGNEVFRQLQNLRADLYIMGVTGVHPEGGLSIRNYEESLIKRRMMESSKQVIVCSTEEKLQNTDPYRICEFTEIDTLITSLPPTDEQLKAFQGLGVTVI